MTLMITSRTNSLICSLLVMLSTVAASTPAAAEDDRDSVLIDPNIPVFTSANYDGEYKMLARGVRQGINKALNKHKSLLSPIKRGQLSKKIRSSKRFESRIDIAAEWSQVGIERYENLETEKAIEDLEKALEHYRTFSFDLLAPRQLSQVTKYLALAYLDVGDHPARSTELLKLTVRLDPTQRLREGYYSKTIVTAYKSARQSLVRELVEYGPDRNRLGRVHGFVDSDFIITGFVAPSLDDAKDFQAHLFLHHSKEGIIARRQKQITSLTPQSLQKASKKLVDQLIPALRKVNRGQKTPAETASNPWASELNFNYGSFLEYPDTIEYPFGHFGASFGVKYRLNPDFFLQSRLQFLNSIPDYNGLILNNFTTIRGFLGPEISVELSRIRFGASLSLETTRIGGFQVCGNLDSYAEGCPDPQDRVTYDDSELLIGINFRPAISIQIYRSIDLRGSIDGSYYIYPFRDHPLNFPVTGQLGILYDF